MTSQKMKNAHAIPAEKVLQQLGVSPETGLSTTEAARRLRNQGKNELPPPPQQGMFNRIVKQLTDPMILVLLAAAAISAALGEWTDSLIITTVIALNAFLSIYQEGKAEKAAEALLALAAPRARVRRNGEICDIPAAELVYGDIVLVEAGDAVPADMRVIESHSLRADESALTGESVPVDKSAAPCPDNADLAERNSMLHSGCPVVYGRGMGCVTACAGDTEMGRIAALLGHGEEKRTPLQMQLDKLSHLLSFIVCAICLFIFVLSLIKGGNFSGTGILEVFMLAVSLAVAAIPEGLVVVVTLVLSIGTSAMSKKRAIIRRLTAVETLGCTQVICTDKTGTLTLNKMTVRETAGVIKPAFIAFSLCSESVRGAEGFAGDPTEAALCSFAAEHGWEKAELERTEQRVGELPFDSERRMMTTLHLRQDGTYCQYTKGAPEAVLKRCTHRLDDQGNRVLLTPKDKEQILNRSAQMAASALRVLAAAKRDYPRLAVAPKPQEEQLTFLGLAGMSDPPRPEAKEAVIAAKHAGIRTVMISGDNPATATAIARETGICSDTEQAVCGAELAGMKDLELSRFVRQHHVFARVRPEDKLRIVNAWRRNGVITAMTGDGVNDAPALKSADIGIGMGKNGSEVAKRVSSLVLADDNFATIISAVREGRRIYENIRKAVQFLLASNLAEVLAIFIATMLSFKLFLPIHLLWINLITDCFPAIALGMEQEEPAQMRQKPRPAHQHIFSQRMALDVLWQGTFVSLLTVYSFMAGCAQDTATAMTMAFVTLSAAELLHSFNMRSRTESIFRLPSHNLWLYASAGVSFALNLLIMYVSPLAELFHLSALGLGELGLAFGLGALIIPASELVKLLRHYK